MTSDFSGAGKCSSDDHEGATRKTEHAPCKANRIPPKSLEIRSTPARVTYKSGTSRTILSATSYFAVAVSAASIADVMSTTGPLNTSAVGI